MSTHAGEPVWPAEQAEYVRRQAAAQAQVSPVVWDAAWAAGRAMPLSEVIEEARAGSVVSDTAHYGT
ncbi:MAG: hypothetical protein M3R61_02115 [Chloroflexota bacterium]|nr:hypothetical protein [Chloroflexota bacterium]